MIQRYASAQLKGKQTESRRPKVVICQYRLLHYRVDLFQSMKQLCDEQGIQLELVYGQPSKKESSRKDTAELSWGTKVRNKFVNVAGVDVLWQPFPRVHRDADLIIFMQENRILSNYAQIVRSWFSNRKVAYWGHGVNFQSKSPSGVRETWKRLWTNSVDWWFSYTELTDHLLTEAGVPQSRITTLNNSVNTSALKADYDSFSEEELSSLRDRLSIEASADVAVFCGSLYAEKKLDLLLSASDVLREKLPGFHLIVIGDGPGAAHLKRAAEARPWLHLLGVRKGREKAGYLRLAKVMLNPGLLGLHILDSFSIGIPIVSTSNAAHSPEIAYVENGWNGVLVGDDVEEYANAVLRLFVDDDYYGMLSQNASESGESYSLENMAARFCSGITQCLTDSQRVVTFASRGTP